MKGLQDGPSRVLGFEWDRYRPVPMLAVVMLAIVMGTAAARAGINDAPDGADLLGVRGVRINESVLHFEFAPPRYVPPKLHSDRLLIPLGSAPQPDRRCSLPGEMDTCIRECAEQVVNPFPRPAGPINAISPLLAVRSCDVRTIGGMMTLVCTCENPGRYALGIVLDEPGPISAENAGDWNWPWPDTAQ